MLLNVLLQGRIKVAGMAVKQLPGNKRLDEPDRIVVELEQHELEALHDDRKRTEALDVEAASLKDLVTQREKELRLKESEIADMRAEIELSKYASVKSPGADIDGSLRKIEGDMDAMCERLREAGQRRGALRVGEVCASLVEANNVAGLEESARSTMAVAEELRANEVQGEPELLEQMSSSLHELAQRGGGGNYSDLRRADADE